MGALPKEGEASTVTHRFSFHLSRTFPVTFFGNQIAGLISLA
jgi:hypothetical protein